MVNEHPQAPYWYSCANGGDFVCVEKPEQRCKILLTGSTLVLPQLNARMPQPATFSSTAGYICASPALLVMPQKYSHRKSREIAKLAVAPACTLAARTRGILSRNRRAHPAGMSIR